MPPPPVEPRMELLQSIATSPLPFKTSPSPSRAPLGASPSAAAGAWQQTPIQQQPPSRSFLSADRGFGAEHSVLLSNGRWMEHLQQPQRSRYAGATGQGAAAALELEEEDPVVARLMRISERADALFQSLSPARVAERWMRGERSLN